MSSPEQAGPTRPARLAGLGLLALALVALVIGLIQLLGGDDTPPVAQPTGSSESQQPPASSGQPNSSSSAPQPPPTSSASPPTSTQPTGSATPPSTQPPPQQPTSAAPPQPPQPGQPGQQPNRSEPVRVYNNSYIDGLAERAANDFRGVGWNVVDTGPHQGRITETTVYYRPGTAEEAQAKELAQEFGLRVEPRFDGIKNASPGIIVIVTKEYSPKAK